MATQQTLALSKTYNKRLQPALIQYFLNANATQDQIFINAIKLILEEMEGVESVLKFTYLSNTMVMMRLNNYNLIENYKKIQTAVDLIFSDKDNKKNITNQLIAFGIFAASQTEVVDTMKQAALDALAEQV